MDYTVHGIAESQTRLSDFHFSVKLNTFTFCANKPGLFLLAKLKFYPFNNPLSPFPIPGNYHSTFCLYDSDHSRDFISVESINICPFLEGLFYLVECLLGLCML